MLGTLVYGRCVFLVEGTYDDVNRLCSELADRHPWAFVNVNLRPYYAEGSKTVGYEIVEQLGWRAGPRGRPVRGRRPPDEDLEGVRELRDLGLIDAVPTRMHAAQAAGCGPIVTMIRGAPTSSCRCARTRSRGRSPSGIPRTATTRPQAVRESGGWAAHATDEEILEAMELLARTEGIFAETAGGVTLAATKGSSPRAASDPTSRSSSASRKRAQDRRSPGTPAGRADARGRKPGVGRGRAAGAQATIR